MRIVPSISLSWTIERQIESEDCNDDDEGNDEGNNDDDEPNDPPGMPNLPDPVHIKNCDEKLYGWYLLEFQKYTLNKSSNGITTFTVREVENRTVIDKTYTATPYYTRNDSYSIGVGGSASVSGIHYATYGGQLSTSYVIRDGSLVTISSGLDNDQIELVKEYSDKWLDPAKTRIWLYNPSKKPSFRRTVISNSDDNGYDYRIEELTYICYEKAAMFSKNNPNRPMIGVVPDYYYLVQAKYWWDNGGITLSHIVTSVSEYAGDNGRYSTSGSSNSQYEYTTNLYPLEIKPPDPEPPIEYPKMKKECCSDPKLMRMVKDIHDVLEPDKIKKSSVPKRFLAIDGEGEEKLKSYNEIFQALFLMLDKQGYVPFGVKKETADGDEIVLDFKHQSQALQAIIGHLINMDQDTQETEQIKALDRKYGEVTARLALAICQILSTTIHTNEMCYAILQFLGFKTTDSYDNVPTSLDPISLKEFSDIDINTEDDPDAFNDKIMAILFSDSDLKVPAIKMSDPKTLQTALLELKLLLTKPIGIKK